ncbi:MAG: hypothetical protein QXN55_08755, partial [Candidatus Nitrosotenuis sp.]
MKAILLFGLMIIGCGKEVVTTVIEKECDCDDIFSLSYTTAQGAQVDDRKGILNADIMSTIISVTIAAASE